MALAYPDDTAEAVRAGDRSAIVLDMLTEIMGRLNHKASCDDVPIRRLGLAIRADAAVSLDVPPAGVPTPCATWPSPEAAAELVRAVQAHGAASSQHFRRFHHPMLGQVVVVVITWERVGAPHAFSRLFAFSRRAGFAEDDLGLLHRACVPLSELWPFAAHCHQARQADHAAHRLAQTYQMTSREIEVLALLAEGLLATSIAARLALSPRTVHKHLGNIYRKLGVHDRLVAVKLGRHYGLLPPSADEGTATA